jgi:hypothetical protein
MNNQKEREEVKKHFKDPTRVDRMSDAQVIAIYRRLQAQGKLAK